jgi:hypothetical protein
MIACPNARLGRHVILLNAAATSPLNTKKRIGSEKHSRTRRRRFPPPNDIRVCPSPFYVSFEDVWNVVEYLHDILGESEYERFSERGNGAIWHNIL